METARPDEEAILLRLALDAAGLGAWTTDLDLKCLKWDARTRELLGHGDDDPDYMDSFLSNVHHDDRDWVDHAVRQALGDQRMLDVEYRVVNPLTGLVTWIQARGAIIAKDGRRWMAGTVQDVTTRRQADDLRTLLAGEIQHRMKNMLTMVLAIIEQTTSRHTDPKEVHRIVVERVRALAGATDMLSDRQARALMSDLVEAATLPIAGSGIVRAEGPEMILAADTVVPLTLILHELSTNSVKHGSLSSPAGGVNLRWSMEECAEGSFVAIEWLESGGPPVRIPGRRGFGTRLIETAFRHVAGSTSNLEHLPSGLRWSMRAPADALLITQETSTVA